MTRAVATIALLTIAAGVVITAAHLVTSGVTP